MMRAVLTLSVGLLVLGVSTGCRDAEPKKAGLPRIFVRHFNPDELGKAPTHSQVVLVAGAARTVYVSGQHGTDGDNQVVSQGDIRLQTERALKNVEHALAAAGAKRQHVVKCTIYLVQGQPAEACLEVYQKAWGDQSKPPAMTLVYVPALIRPEFLVAIDVVAFIPQD
jgi:enamine deaminase RidA (YjgF/YER057c/UK114 family)